MLRRLWPHHPVAISVWHRLWLDWRPSGHGWLLAGKTRRQILLAKLELIAPGTDLRPPRARDPDRLEYRHDAAAAHLIAHDPRRLPELWHRWFRRGKVRSESLSLVRLRLVLRLEHHHDDHD